MRKSIFLIFMMIIISLTPNAFAADQIVFSRLTHGFWQIWTMDPDGTNQQQITTTPIDKRTPAWAENGKKIIYRTNNSQLFFFDLKTKEEKEILRKYNAINNPDYSDVTKEVVFVRFDPRGNDLSDLWKADINEENAQILTRDNILKYQPKFSPDGKSICYVEGRKESPMEHHLWIMDTEGKNRQKLTKGKGFNTLPSFSPNQRYLVFTSNRDQGDYEIYLYDLKTKQEKRLTNNPGLDTHACFSPDGKKIAFVSNRSGNQQIWMMNKDGKNATQITFGDESIEPGW